MKMISVILPAYNAEEYIADAIKSILNQEYGNFELIIINDGSTDKTKEIILSFNDSRIVFVDNISNKGLIKTLNIGLNLVKGEYIARMDADDISLPERFTKQVEFLENNPDYVICGTSAYYLYNKVKSKRVVNIPFSNDDIRIRMFFNSAFIHPTVMFRTTTVKDNNLQFSEDYKYAEDYHFWYLLLKYGKGLNIKEKLLYYRVLENSQTAVGNSNISQRKKILGAIHKLYYTDNDIVLDDKQIELVFYLSNIHRSRSLDLDAFKLQYIYAFFAYLKSSLIKKGFCIRNINYGIGRFYFMLYYAKKKITLSLDIKLFFYGILGFLKEYIFK